MGSLVYILCAVTSLGCGILLWRGYRKNGLRLLFWSSICFMILALSNALLFFDLILFPGVSLLIARSAVTLVALLVLMYGLIFESN